MLSPSLSSVVASSAPSWGFGHFLSKLITIFCRFSEKKPCFLVKIGSQIFQNIRSWFEAGFISLKYLRGGKY